MGPTWATTSVAPSARIWTTVRWTTPAAAAPPGVGGADHALGAREHDSAACHSHAMGTPGLCGHECIRFGALVVAGVLCHDDIHTVHLAQPVPLHGRATGLGEQTRTAGVDATGVDGQITIGALGEDPGRRVCVVRHRGGGPT